MTLVLTILANDILPIFAAASVGFLLARRLHVDVGSVSKVIFNALAPCLVFHMIVTTQVSAGEFWRIALFTFLLVTGIGLTARAVAIPFRLERPQLAAFLIVVMFSNAGNYGLPLVLFAFGRDGLARAVVYFVASTLLSYTLGTYLASSGRRGGWAALRALAKVPALWGLAAAGLVVWTGVSLPAALMRPVELLAASAIPTMLLVLGMQFEKGTRLERPALVAAASALALVGAPLIGFALAALLGLTGLARQAVLVESAMPSAVLTTILALEYDVAPRFVTAVVVVTTLASPVTVSVLVALLQSGY